MKIHVLAFLFPMILPLSCLTLASTSYKDRSVENQIPSAATYDGSLYRLSIECNLPEALIFLDGSLYGQTDRKGYFSIKIRSGAYDLKVVKEGFEPYSRNVRLDRDRSLRFTLSQNMKPRIKG